MNLLFKTTFIHFRRVDFNVPLENGKVADSTRITASIPTLRFLLNSGAKKIILISHLGRPDGERKESLSLKPVAIELEALMEEKVRFINDCVGDEVVSACNSSNERLVMLENLRFHIEEEGTCKRKDGSCISSSLEDQIKFQSSLSQLGDIYVNDAFGTVHRSHSSISGITIKTRVAGLLVQKELQFFSKALEGPEKIHTLILGGAKVSDKILLIEHMLPRVENIIIGGGMAYTFLNVLNGMEIGKSLFDEKGSKLILNIIEKAKEEKVKIHLPIDFIEASEFSESAEFRIVNDSIDDDWMGLDIGPDTCKLFAAVIDSAQTNKVILWNGPMGVFEWQKFANGTLTILEAIAASTERGNITIVGGGDSAAAVSKWNYESKIKHVSTGGGASLELLEGKCLPGIEHLSNKTDL